jgi:hypothetical protein
MPGKNTRPMWYDEKDIARLVMVYRPFFRWPISGPAYARTGVNGVKEAGVISVHSNSSLRDNR